MYMYRLLLLSLYHSLFCYVDDVRAGSYHDVLFRALSCNRVTMKKLFIRPFVWRGLAIVQAVSYTLECFDCLLVAELGHWPLSGR